LQRRMAMNSRAAGASKADEPVELVAFEIVDQ
jgi:hypothetical protein